jgi:hypothetical protein
MTKISPWPKDTERQPENDRAAMFLSVFRIAINRGFYPDVFGIMAYENVMALCVDYIVHGRELLTIFDPHFLECLYGDAATKKAHWLIELRMRGMDIVPALHADMTARIIVEPEPPTPSKK